MIKKISLFTILLTILMTACAMPVQASAYSVFDSNQNEYAYNDMDRLQEQIEETNIKIEAVNKILEGYATLGYSENNSMTEAIYQELKEAEKMKEEYSIIYTILSEKWTEKEKEYPAATYIWTYFKDKGYSDFVIAGMLGNMMTEAGGQTLNIQAEIYDKSESYYGICQWSLKYFPEVADNSLEEQCDFLYNTIEEAFNVYGKRYSRTFSYEKFLELDDSRKVAIAFAKCYERCSHQSFKTREENAINAYNYFIS